MFPLNWNIPFIRKNGSRTTLGAITGDIAGLTDKTECLWANMKNNGAVNMLPNNATSQVVNGITFTVNDDGTVTANGTATADASLLLSNIVYPKGTYKKSGCPSGGSYSTYFMGGTTGNDLGDGIIFTADGTTSYNTYCNIQSGATVSNLVFKPMICLASYNGDYVPYAKSNKELTDDIDTVSLQISDLKTTSSSTVTFSSAIASITSAAISKSGNVVTFFFDFTVGDTDISAWDATWCKVPSGFYDTSNDIRFVPCGLKNSSSTIIYFVVSKTTGNLTTGITLVANTRYVCSGVYII